MVRSNIIVTLIAIMALQLCHMGSLYKDPTPLIISARSNFVRIEDLLLLVFDPWSLFTSFIATLVSQEFIFNWLGSFVGASKIWFKRLLRALSKQINIQHLTLVLG